MTSYIELHAIQNVPPANLNRDDTGAPKTAMYGGVLRGRVSSQSWKRAMREHFNHRLEPTKVGRRSKHVVELIAKAVVSQDANLSDRAEDLATVALKSADFKPAKPKKNDAESEAAQLGYLLFVSQQQIDAAATAIVQNADAGDEKALTAAFKAAGMKKFLDSDHSVDIALFGRMVADAPDLNVDAACQVAHALGVHEVVPEYDYFTAVDDVTMEAEEAGAGMIGTVEFYSATFYRYAALNVDQLRKNLGDDTAARMAISAFVEAFVEAMPSGKQNTFANGTRPAAVMATVASGQPASLVGAFEEPVKDAAGHVRPSIEALAEHANEVFSTWRRPEQVLVCGLSSHLGSLADVGEVVPFADLAQRLSTAGSVS